MKCPMCGFTFDLAEKDRACKGCSLFGGCRLLRCPNCRYEWPPEPEWIERLKKRFGRKAKSAK